MLQFSTLHLHFHFVEKFRPPSMAKFKRAYWHSLLGNGPGKTLSPCLLDRLSNKKAHICISDILDDEPASFANLGLLCHLSALRELFESQLAF